MNYSCIQYEVLDRVLLLTLHRPNMLNAYTMEMHAELLDALDRADLDDEIRAVVVTGAGRGFCAGADLSGGQTFVYDSDPMEHRDAGGILSLRMFSFKKPIIAAINGAAVGIGATMLLPMDIRIASSKAKFGFVFARRGVINEACSGYFLPRIVGISQALEWTFTGRIFPAEEALRGGLVSRIVEPEELLPTAIALAHEIADNTSAVSVAIIRQNCWRMLGAQHPMESHEVESLFFDWLGSQPDSLEGVNAFLEKRPAHFTMGVSKDLPAQYFPWWTERTFRNR